MCDLDFTFVFFIPPPHSLLLVVLTYHFVSSSSRTALATFHEGKHNIAFMDMDPSRGLMVTCGSDRVIKVRHTISPDH